MMLESGFHPESEKTDATKERMYRVAEKLLSEHLDEAKFRELGDQAAGEYLQQAFQKHLEHFYYASGFDSATAECKNDDELLKLAVQKSNGTHGWLDMLPKLIALQEDTGMNCTMSSAMLHIALEKKGYQNVRTVSVKNHHFVLRELDDHTIKIYDPSAQSTIDDELQGYSRIFNENNISNKTEVEENAGRKGYSFKLDRGEKDAWGGFHDVAEDGTYSKKCYAYDPTIKMDIAIALGNLSEIKDDLHNADEVQRQQVQKLVDDFPDLAELDYEEIKRKFGLFSTDEFI